MFLIFTNQFLHAILSLDSAIFKRKLDSFGIQKYNLKLFRRVATVNTDLMHYIILSICTSDKTPGLVAGSARMISALSGFNIHGMFSVSIHTPPYKSTFQWVTSM